MPLEGGLSFFRSYAAIVERKFFFKSFRINMTLKGCRGIILRPTIICRRLFPSRLYAFRDTNFKRSLKSLFI